MEAPLEAIVDVLLDHFAIGDCQAHMDRPRAKKGAQVTRTVNDLHFDPTRDVNRDPRLQTGDHEVRNRNVQRQEIRLIDLQGQTGKVFSIIEYGLKQRQHGRGANNHTYVVGTSLDDAQACILNLQLELRKERVNCDGEASPGE